jgi:hypothetical protein
MAFFRTRETQDDRSIGASARRQRRQQLQAQQLHQAAREASQPDVFPGLAAAGAVE